MSPLTRTLRLLNLAWLSALATPLAAEAVPDIGPDSVPAAAAAPAAAAPAAAAEAALAGFKLSGYAEASYVYSTAPADPNIVLGHPYDRYSNAFYFNAFKLVADRAFDPKKVSAGVRAELYLGQNAAVTQSSGLSLGPNGDLTQAYAILNLPTGSGNGMQIKMGKMVTLMGLEVIETPFNPVWSIGNQFTFVEPVTSTGVELDLKPSGALDVQLRVDNGWDRTVVGDGQKSFMGRVGITGSSMTLGLLGYYGEMQSGLDAARYGFQALLNKKLGKASLWIQGDYGMEAENANLADPTQDATWWALGVWLATDLSANTNFSVRGDYLNDAQGARTAGAFGLGPVFAGGGTYDAHALWSITGNLNIKTFPGVLIRPEVRYDQSNYDVYDDGNSGSQVVAAISVAYIF